MVKAHLTKLQLAAEKAKSIAEQSALAANRLHSTTKQLEIQCCKIQTEIEEFTDNYIKSIENHRKNLLEQVNHTRNEKLEEINKCKMSLHKRVKEARDLAFFLEELLNDGTDVEVMSFLKPVIKKIEKTNKKSDSKIVHSFSESLQFLPDEVSENTYLCPLYGVVNTQIVFPTNCILNTEGKKIFVLA